MASSTNENTLNIDLVALERKINEGVANIHTVCPLFWNGKEIVNNKEYKRGDTDDKYINIIKECLDVTDEVAKGLYCRDHIYKTANPAKAAHGKIFEDNFNQALSCAFIPDNIEPTVFLNQNKIENTSVLDTFKLGYHLKSKLDYEIPIFKYYPLPQLEWQHDALDFAVKHFADINTPIFDMRSTNVNIIKLREEHHLHHKMNYCFSEDPENPEKYPIVNELRKKMNNIMGTGLNIKYSAAAGVENGKWYPNKAEMADFRNFWNDTHEKERWLTNDGAFSVLPFVGVWGVWKDVDITEDLHYKCGKGVWLIDFSFSEELDKILWGENPNETYEKLEKFALLLQDIKEKTNEIRKEPNQKKQDDKYREALALWYGEKGKKIGTGKSTGGKMIAKDKHHYNNEIQKNKDEGITPMEEFYQEINNYIIEKGGIMRLNQKVFSWKSGNWRPERVQVGFIPSKIKGFLKNMEVIDKARYISYDKNIPGHSRLFIPIKFTRIDYTTDKVAKVKKAVIKKLSVKTLKMMFKLTKQSKISPGGFHNVSISKIKSKNIDSYIDQWNGMLPPHLSRFKLDKENLTNEIGVNICTTIANNLHLLIDGVNNTTPNVGDNEQKVGGGQKGGNNDDIEEYKKNLHELIDIKNNLEDVDLLIDDIEIPDGEKLYDIENELNKYIYIMEKEKQYGGDENVVLVIEDILKTDKEKLYEKQIDDIQFLVDVSIEETPDSEEEGLKAMIIKYDNLLKFFFKHMRELTEVYNTDTQENVDNMLEAYCHWRHQTKYKKLKLTSYNKHQTYKILKDISEIEAIIYNFIDSKHLKIPRKRGDRSPIQMDPEKQNNFLKTYGYYGKICIYVSTEGSEFIENIYQKFDNLLDKRIFDKVDEDLEFFCNKSGIQTRGRKSSSIDIFKRISSSPTSNEELQKKYDECIANNKILEEHYSRTIINHSKEIQNLKQQLLKSDETINKANEELQKCLDELNREKLSRLNVKEQSKSRSDSGDSGDSGNSRDGNKGSSSDEDNNNRKDDNFVSSSSIWDKFSNDLTSSLDTQNSDNSKNDSLKSQQSSNDSMMRNQTSNKYTDSNVSGDNDIKHIAKKRVKGKGDENKPGIEIDELDSQEENLRFDIITRLNGMDVKRLENVLNNMTTNTSPINLTADAKNRITESGIVKRNEYVKGNSDLKNAYGEPSPKKEKRKSANRGKVMRERSDSAGTNIPNMPFFPAVQRKSSMLATIMKKPDNNKMDVEDDIKKRNNSIYWDAINEYVNDKDELVIMKNIYYNPHRKYFHLEPHEPEDVEDYKNYDTNDNKFWEVGAGSGYGDMYNKEWDLISNTFKVLRDYEFIGSGDIEKMLMGKDGIFEKISDQVALYNGISGLGKKIPNEKKEQERLKGLKKTFFNKSKKLIEKIISLNSKLMQIPSAAIIEKTYGSKFKQPRERLHQLKLERVNALPRKKVSIKNKKSKLQSEVAKKFKEMLFEDEKGAPEMHIVPQFLSEYKKRKGVDIAEVGGLDQYIEEWLDRERDEGGFIDELRRNNPGWFIRPPNESEEDEEEKSLADESKRRDMLVMEMLKRNNKPFTENGWTVQENVGRVEQLMETYGKEDFEEALEEWENHDQFNQDNKDFWNEENGIKGGKKKRKKSRKRHKKKNKKGGTRKKYKYYFNEYI